MRKLLLASALGLASLIALSPTPALAAKKTPTTQPAKKHRTKAPKPPKPHKHKKKKTTTT